MPWHKVGNAWEASLGGRGLEHHGIWFELGMGRTELGIYAQAIEDHGLVVTIAGGERPHIGAVALAQPRPSLRDPHQRSATTSVLALVGHKDDEVARSMANQLAQASGRATTVIAGIHVDQATDEEIEQFRSLCRQAVERILRWLASVDN